MVIVLGLAFFCASTFQQVHGQMGVGLGICGMRGMGSCFGTGYYARQKMFCCSGKPFPCPNPGRWACCGKALVDKSLYFCCNNDPQPKGPGMACCDKYIMHMGSYICCDGEICPKMGLQTYCCKNKPYDPQTQTCCSKDIVMKADAAYNLACAPGNDAPRSLPPPYGGPHPGAGPPHGHSHPPQSLNYGPSPPTQFGPHPGQGFHSGPPPPSFNSQTPHPRTPQPNFNQPPSPFQQPPNLNPGTPPTSIQNRGQPNPQTMGPRPHPPFSFNLQALQQMLRSPPNFKRNVG